MHKQQMDLRNIRQQIDFLTQLLERLQLAADVHRKLAILDELPQVEDFLSQSRMLRNYLSGLNPYFSFVIKSVLAIGQGPIVFQSMDHPEENLDQLRNMLLILLEVERFYKPIGGIIGYHLTILKLIDLKDKGRIEAEGIRYLKPKGLNIAKDSYETRLAVRWGIQAVPEIADIYPVGGAGDRLSLTDEVTGEPLPAAQLIFRGYTLLENLIRDLQGREYLYYKLYNRQVITPLILMTSEEKHNHRRVTEICSGAHWFGRPQDTFHIFTQPMVPVVTKEGNWSLFKPFQLNLKPGGHGTLWKLLSDEGLFEKLKKRNRKKVLIRQINNPIAGTDHGLLAFTGIGCKNDKAFGFSSCPRLLGTAEGMDVLIEKATQGEYEYSLTNIEYTDFSHKGIEDVPENPGSKYSAFPSNTNILFADINVAEKIIEAEPIPGMIINMKSMTSSLDPDGRIQPVEAGRLESTMQNIADYITASFDEKLPPDKYDQLPTFIIFNERRKTISVTKSTYIQGKSIIGTPEGCLYEVLQNQEELLKDFCKMKVPAMGSEEEYLLSGPPFLFDYHPALGPLWSVIGQKIQEGKLAFGSELMLEIAEIEMRGLELDGSLRISADQAIGNKDMHGVLQYGAETGRCTLKNVKIANLGIDRSANNKYWKGDIQRHEQCSILIHGNGEFVAENITLQGNIYIEVPNGYRITALDAGKGLEFVSEPIQGPSWHWLYTFDEEHRLVLEKKIR